MILMGRYGMYLKWFSRVAYHKQSFPIPLHHFGGGFNHSNESVEVKLNEPRREYCKIISGKTHCCY